MPPLNAKVADMAPDEPALTPYDEQHAVTYVRLLDAETDNADWQRSRAYCSPYRSDARAGPRSACLRQPFGSREVGGAPRLS